MDKKVKDYIQELELQYKVLRDQYLIEHHYCEKVVSEEAKEGYIYDPAAKVYYKYEVIKGKDPELDRIVELEKRMNRFKKASSITNTFKVLAIIESVISVIAFFYFGYETSYSFGFFILFSGVILSFMLWGIAKLAEILREQ